MYLAIIDIEPFKEYRLLLTFENGKKEYLKSIIMI